MMYLPVTLVLLVQECLLFVLKKKLQVLLCVTPFCAYRTTGNAWSFFGLQF